MYRMARLRAVRVEHLLTIRELARLARVAPSTIYLIETGRVTPRTRVMRAVASALDVSPHEIDEFRRAIEAAKMLVEDRQPSPAEQVDRSDPQASYATR
jgi:transcriptional regulator with XRE-family HTH domain